MAFPTRSIPPHLFLSEWSITDGAILLDVRTGEEILADGTLPQARHLDYLDTTFEEAIETLDRLNPYYVFCDTGKRSRLACELMASKGFILIAYLEGGTQALSTPFQE
ncbi:MAG: rhodanese-like domain-containing protein [Saprospiraceae bacterium]|nr:rhodanese-like domain-containing protein [Saprospiraceae bacterium]